MYIGDFISLARRVGFNDPRELSRTVINVQQHSLRNVLGNANFYSITHQRRHPRNGIRRQWAAECALQHRQFVGREIHDAVAAPMMSIDCSATCTR